jgi:hypothetical protein
MPSSRTQVSIQSTIGSKKTTALRSGSQKCQRRRSKAFKHLAQKYISSVVDVVLMLVCVAILTFAVLAYRADGGLMGSYEKSLLDIARIVHIS